MLRDVLFDSERGADFVVLRKANHCRQVVPLHVTKVSIRQHTSAYVSIRQHACSAASGNAAQVEAQTSAYVCIRYCGTLHKLRGPGEIALVKQAK